MLRDLPHNEDDPFTVVLYDMEGSFTRLELSEEPKLDAHYGEYLKTQRDELLSLTMLSGDTLKIATSRISNWTILSVNGIVARERLDSAIHQMLKANNPDGYE